MEALRCLVTLLLCAACATLSYTSDQVFPSQHSRLLLFSPVGRLVCLILALLTVFQVAKEAKQQGLALTRVVLDIGSDVGCPGNSSISSMVVSIQESSAVLCKAHMFGCTWQIAG